MAADESAQRRLVGMQRRQVQVAGHAAGEETRDQDGQDDQRQKPRDALHAVAGVAFKDQS